MNEQDQVNYKMLRKFSEIRRRRTTVDVSRQTLLQRQNQLYSELIGESSGNLSVAEENARYLELYGIQTRLAHTDSDVFCLEDMEDTLAALLRKQPLPYARDTADMEAAVYLRDHFRWGGAVQMQESFAGVTSDLRERRYL